MLIALVVYFTISFLASGWAVWRVRLDAKEDLATDGWIIFTLWTFFLWPLVLALSLPEVTEYLGEKLSKFEHKLIRLGLDKNE